MKNGERMLVRIMREIAREKGYEIKTFSHDWVIKLSKAGRERVVFGYEFALNTAAASAVCADKAAASALMGDRGLPRVEHRFFIHPSGYAYVGGPGNFSELLKMLETEKELVCKPNEGTGGSLVFRASDAPSLENAYMRIFAANRSMAVCKYHKIKSEHRVFILDGQALAIYEKILPFVIGDGTRTAAALAAQKYPANVTSLVLCDTIPKAGEKVGVGWLHNLAKGSVPKVLELNSPLARNLAELAVKAAEACGARFVSVDIISTEDSKENDMLVLEINGGVMMESFASVSEANYEIAKAIYAKATDAMQLL